jgi:hypothetical protein
MAWKFNRAYPLIARGSYTINDLAVIPRSATKAIRFVEHETGEMFTTTDLAIKKSKRKKALSDFQDAYKIFLKKKSVTIMLIVVPVENYRTVGEFIKGLKDKFGRRKIYTYGYYWQRDIGDVLFEMHYHIMLAVSRIDASAFKELMENKKPHNYKVVLCNSLERYKNYLKKKEIYAPHKCRAYGRSEEYRTPLDA